MWPLALNTPRKSISLPACVSTAGAGSLSRSLPSSPLDRLVFSLFPRRERELMKACSLVGWPSSWQRKLLVAAFVLHACEQERTYKKTREIMLLCGKSSWAYAKKSTRTSNLYVVGLAWHWVWAICQLVPTEIIEEHIYHFVNEEMELILQITYFFQIIIISLKKFSKLFFVTHFFHELIYIFYIFLNLKFKHFFIRKFKQM